MRYLLACLCLLCSITAMGQSSLITVTLDSNNIKCYSDLATTTILTSIMDVVVDQTSGDLYTTWLDTEDPEHPKAIIKYWKKSDNYANPVDVAGNNGVDLLRPLDGVYGLGYRFDGTSAHLYIADAVHSRINHTALAALPENNVEQLIGSRGRTLATGSTPRFMWPDGVAVSSLGDFLYVVDRLNCRVAKIYLDSGIVVATWGGYGTGPNQFLDPRRIVVDEYDSADDPTIYVSDGALGCVKRFKFSNAEQATIIGNPDPNGPGYLSSPYGLALLTQVDISPAPCLLFVVDSLNPLTDPPGCVHIFDLTNDPPVWHSTKLIGLDLPNFGYPTGFTIRKDDPTNFTLFVTDNIVNESDRPAIFSIPLHVPSP